MMATLADALPSAANPQRSALRAHPFRRLLRRRGAALGLAVIVFFVVLAVLAPVLSPYDPLATSWAAIRKAPTAEHWFGTDEIGRDVLARVVWGARASLLAGVVSVLISMSIGRNGYDREDGTSLTAKSVDYAFGKGVLCVVAAGNQADEHYAAPFTDSDGDGYHEFAPGKQEPWFPTRRRPDRPPDGAPATVAHSPRADRLPDRSSRAPEPARRSPEQARRCCPAIRPHGTC